jgi:periplasmic protein TonB
LVRYIRLVMYREENRALHYAIAASIVLHGVLLFGIVQRDRPRAGEPQMPSILARLVELPSSAPAAEAPPQPAPAKSAPQARPAAPKRITRPAPAPTPAPQPPAEAVLQEAPVAQAPAESPSPSPQRAGDAQDATTGAAVLSAPPAAPPGEDPGSLEKYRLQLIAVAPRYKHYPLSARRNDWRGVVALRMVVAPSGQVASLVITKTSGHEVLDRQAQEMFRSAAAEVPVPPVLRGKQFAVDVAVDYYLTE